MPGVTKPNLVIELAVLCPPDQVHVHRLVLDGVADGELSVADLLARPELRPLLPAGLAGGLTEGQPDDRGRGGREQAGSALAMDRERAAAEGADAYGFAAYGRRRRLTDRVRTGDRIEILPALLLDPKAARLARVTERRLQSRRDRWKTQR